MSIEMQRKFVAMLLNKPARDVTPRELLAAGPAYEAHLSRSAITREALAKLYNEEYRRIVECL